MSADRLREAARVLRERAEAATKGRWQSRGPGVGYPAHVAAIDWDERGRRTTRFITHAIDVSADATFIATMHPGAALTVARWLDDEAEWVEADECYMHDKALAVADAILGGTQ